MKKLAILVIIVVIVALGFYFGSSDTTTEQGSPEGGTSEQMQEELSGKGFELEANLSDVTEGEIRGINTGGQASGFAVASFSEGRYFLSVIFEDLPEPVGSDFYEGWVVRTGEDMSVVSTGALINVDGVYRNEFHSDTDLSDHSLYVLTIEPDDGNPSPAGHILEGSFEATEG